jgi:hypothetical protein
MKEETIKIRLTSKLKGDFEEVCKNQDKTMSDKIHSFIKSEVYKFNVTKNHNDFLMFLGANGFSNIKVIDNPSHMVITEDGPKQFFVEEYNGDFIEFVKINNDKTIYLYLFSSDIPNNTFRAFVV